MLEDAVKFVLMRVKESGGFGATPHLPATIQDTFYGLSIISMLSGFGEVLPPEHHEATKRYLRTTIPQENWSFKALYHYFKACQLLNMISQVKSRVISIYRKKTNHCHGLQDVYYLSLLKREVKLKEEGGGGPGFKKVPPTDLSWKTVTELWMKLSICVESFCPGQERARHIIEWVQKAQNPDGGFGFYPGSTSFIENCYVCLNILRHFNGRPLDPDGVKDFIWRCRGSKGGFARKNGGAPFLDATWHAVACLRLLKSM